MNIERYEIRDNKLHICGYVNAVERDSLPLNTKKRGRCVEQIQAGAFAASMADGHEIRLMFNHKRDIGSTADGSLSLREDNIGLYAEAETSDEELRTLAEKGLLRGWSFGFEATDDEMEERAGNIPRRHVKALNLSEVSVLSVQPAYTGNSIETRSDDTEIRSADLYETDTQTVRVDKADGEIKSVTDTTRVSTMEEGKETETTVAVTTTDHGTATETTTYTHEYKPDKEALDRRIRQLEINGRILQKRAEQRELEQRWNKSRIEYAMYRIMQRGRELEQGHSHTPK